jgi:hypothetical protein
MKMNIEDRDVLERLEEALWRNETRFDTSFMNKVIAADFFEFGRSGRVYQRQDILTIEGRFIDAVLPLPDFQARLLNDNTAHITYNSAVKSDGILEHTRRSSIWSRTENGWVLRFHQGTPFRP